MGAIVGRVTDDFVKLRKEVDRILRHLNIDRCGELRAHPAHTLAGRAFALMRLALDHEHICATGLSELISDTRADNAAADDDHVRGFHGKVKIRRKKGKVKKPRSTTARHAVSEPQ